MFIIRAIVARGMINTRAIAIKIVGLKNKELSIKLKNTAILDG